jgi:hypothetical protein
MKTNISSIDHHIKIIYILNKRFPCMVIYISNKTESRRKFSSLYINEDEKKYLHIVRDFK